MSDEEVETFEKNVLPLLDTLYAGAMRMTRNSEDAADLVQETMEKAYKGFDSYKPGTNIKAWLFRIMTNAMINNYRKNQRQVLQTDQQDPEDWQMHKASEHTSNGLKSAENEVVDAMTSGEVASALKNLNEDYRTVVYYADVEQIPYKEIADTLNIPIGTVMSRLHRGRKQLKKQLEPVAQKNGWTR